MGVVSPVHTIEDLRRHLHRIGDLLDFFELTLEDLHNVPEEVTPNSLIYFDFTGVFLSEESDLIGFMGYIAEDRLDGTTITLVVGLEGQPFHPYEIKVPERRFHVRLIKSRGILRFVEWRGKRHKNSRPQSL